MHELSIAMSIVDMAEEESERLGGRRVTAVHLQLGALSGIAPDALLSSYELACEQTSLAGSSLVIETVPVVVLCTRCDGPRPIRSMQSFCCAECGEPAGDVVTGRELRVTALELQP
jgi:hydrogenase nickel incorporation protein HypA/HybF